MRFYYFTFDETIMMEKRVFCLILLMGVSNGISANSTKRIKALIDGLLHESNYEKNLPPGLDLEMNETTTDVFVELIPSGIHSVSDVEMEFQMEVYLHLSWIDRRLDYSSNLSSINHPWINETGLQLDVSSIGKVWRPNIYFTKEREAVVQDVPRKNELLFIYPNGSIIYSVRISMRHGCPMLLQKYPFDIQTCYINIQSYSISTTYQKLHCPHSHANIEGFQIAQFTLDQNLKCIEYEKNGKIDSFSGIQLTMMIKRKIGNFIMYVFLPSIFIVILSWISFWIHPEIVHGRLSLGIVCVLTMVSKSASLLDQLPPLSYIKAIDVWMIVCQFFVFAALMEYAYVYHTYVNIQKMALVDRRSSHRLSCSASQRQYNSDPNQNETTGHAGQGDEDNADLRRDFQNSLKLKRRENERTSVARQPLDPNKVNVIDKWSRVVFPAVFVIFVIVYFITSPNLPDKEPTP